MYQSSHLIESNIDKGTSRIAQKANTEMNITFLATFAKEEVEMTFKQMAPLKSIGFDGFNLGFYQTY